MERSLDRFGEVFPEGFLTSADYFLKALTNIKWI